jgi:hypothetical protein
MRTALLLLLGIISACSESDAPPSIETSPEVRVECFVRDPECTTSYRLAMEAVDARFSPHVVRASVRPTDVRLCPDGDPRYDVELTDETGHTVEITVAMMQGGDLFACTY